MKCCQPHWDALRAAVQDRGLYGWVAKNGEEAARRFVEPDGPPDPLIEAYNMVFVRALDVLGLSLMEGEKCPVCELLAVTPPPPPGFRYASNEEYFTLGPVDAVRDTFVSKGLLGDA